MKLKTTLSQKHKHIFLATSLATMLILTSCGKKETTSTAKNTKSENTTQAQTTNAPKKETTESTKDKAVDKTVLTELRDIHQEYTSGPMKLTITDIQKITVKNNEQLKPILGDKEVVSAIVLHAIAENTSEKDICFYPDELTAVTNTKEQKEANFLLSDQVGGDFLGKVVKEGNIVILLDSDAKEVNHVKFVISGAYTSDLSKDYNGITFEVNL